MTQQQLIDTPDATDTRIETDGRLIRPALQVPFRMVDECRLHLDGEGVHVRAVDPPNVGMAHLDIHPRAFDAYEHGDDAVTVGVNLDLLTTQLQDARMGKRSADPVRLTLSPTRTVIEIERGYGDTTVTRRDEVLNIDPDSIRKEPDLPDIQLDYGAEVNSHALKDVVEHINHAHDHASLTERDGSLYVGGSRKKDADAGAIVTASDATFENAAEALHDDATEGVSSMFSIDYLRSIGWGVHAAKADVVRVKWADQFPCLVEFERTDDDGALLYEGTYLVAPRITSDD